MHVNCHVWVNDIFVNLSILSHSYVYYLICNICDILPANSLSLRNPFKIFIMIILTFQWETIKKKKKQKQNFAPF